MSRLRVLHCLVNRVTRQYPPDTSSDLLGVNYFRSVPADTEFPKLLAPFEVFVRFYARRRIGGSVWVFVSPARPGGAGPGVFYRRRFALPTVTGPADVVYDRSFKLVGMTVPGAGTYTVRVVRRAGRGWDGRRRWRVLGTDYFQVVRAP
ncbi:MAG: hypothetical protein K2X82_31885 [Gemmataceae bacterium]|nr:hypothetical protein [Gemmataceae bacterium]